MKSFERRVKHLPACRGELRRLRKLLAGRATLSETRDVLPFFQACKDLSLLVGELNLLDSTADRLAFEYDLFGDFACDLVVGNAGQKEYVFVEFEDAAADSVFKRVGPKARRDWSPRFDRGYSQIIDWFCKLHDMEKSDEFEARFGARSISYSGLLVIGRDQHFEPGEQRRLEWRRSYVIVNSKKITCLTFDELVGLLARQLAAYDQAMAPRKPRG
ncbi:MAG TPA: Shedu immune nuclease family protein [Gemmataceae bacterium]|nr:Shedu immune nuclease family protein [Gemmataceae bacterium]